MPQQPSPEKLDSNPSIRRSVPREIPSRWLARELMADNVEVALDPSEVGACLIDLAQVKRVLGSSALPLACPLLVSVRLVMHMRWCTGLPEAGA